MSLPCLKNKPDHGKFNFPGFEEERFAITVNYSPPHNKSKYLPISVSDGTTDRILWIFKSSLISRFTSTPESNQFLVENFPQLSHDLSSDSLRKKDETPSLRKDLFETKVRSPSGSTSPVVKSLASKSSSPCNTPHASSKTSSSPGPSMTPQPVTQTEVASQQLLDTIQLCTKDRSIDLKQVECLREIASISFTPEGNSVSKLNSKEHNISRSIIQAPQGSFLLMTHAKNCADVLLGKGTNKKVKFAIHMQTSQRKAVAIVRGGIYPERPNLGTELEIMMKLKGKLGIIQVDFGCRYDDKHYIFMEHCNQGNLLEALEQNVLSDEEKLNLALEALDGLRCIHAEGIYHRDIKPDNLFITKDTDGKLHIRIADFGLACLKDDQESLSSCSCSPDYAAPEKARELFSMFPNLFSDKRIKEITSDKLDVWAMGITLFQLFNGRTELMDFMNSSNSYLGLTQSILGNIGSITQREMSQEISKCKIHPLLQSLLLKMLQVDPKKRATAEDSHTMLKRILGQSSSQSSSHPIEKAEKKS